MFGKFFASTFTGSMMGAGPEIFAVWSYVIANAVNGEVELNPRLLAAVIGMPVEAVAAAIGHLCSPDERSRAKVHDGRRLIKVGEFSYEVPTHAFYRSIRSEDDRREYNRVKKAESRDRKKSNGQHASTRESRMSAHTEAEAESEADADTDPDYHE